jgi:hypothetical protein
MYMNLGSRAGRGRRLIGSAAIAISGATISVTSNRTIAVAELGALIDVNTSGAGANVVLTLPAAASAGDGAVLTVRLSEATHFVEIHPDGSETVDGASAYTLVLAKQSVTIRCNGASWNVIAEAGTVEIGPDVGNGTYKKYADGTLICEFLGASQDVNTASNSVYRTSATSTWTFPHAFATGSIPSVAGSPETNGRWLSTGAPSNTSVTYRQYSGGQSATASASYMTAIGRWL